MKFTICDDNNSDLQAIETLVNKYSIQNNININIEKHNHPDVLLKHISFKPEEYQVFLLDIVMQKNGIDLAHEIRKHIIDPIIVFQTSSKEFAIDAFGVRAFDYLLKPLDEKQVFSCLDRIIEEIKEHLSKIKGVIDVHHIHIRSIDGFNTYATMHIVVEKYNKEIKQLVKEELEEHGISHTTIELEEKNEKCEHENCDIKQKERTHHHHH